MMKKIISLSMVFILILSSLLASNVSATKTTMYSSNEVIYSDEDIELIANQLELIFTNGSEYNTSQIQARALKKTNPKWTNAQNECIISSLSATYGAGAVSAIYELIKKARWGDAAKKLLKLGIKGTVPGILFSLGATAGACGKEASKKYPRYI